MVTAPGPESPATQDRDWTVEVTDRIESTVSLVRDKTTVPATLVAQGVVFGVVVGVLAAVLVILLVVALVRILNVYLPIHPHARAVWVTYLIAAAIFFGTGAFAWRKRRPTGA